MADLDSLTFALGKDHQTRRAGGRALVVAGIFVLASVAAYFALSAYFLRVATSETPNRAQFFARTLDNALTRLAHLPRVLVMHPAALDALVSEDPADINPMLAEIAQRTGAEFIYLLDINGRTLAASDYRSPNSIVGNHYTFRPYFQEALTGGTGRFFAIDDTTNRPGYYMSEPVTDASGTVFGAVAVKISLEGLSQTWADSGELVFVTNRKGVIFAGSDQRMLFGLLAPISAFDRRTLETRQQFGDRKLFELDWTARDNRATLDGIPYIWSTTQIAAEDWTLHLLSDIAGIRMRALLYVLSGVAVLLALAITATAFRSARLRQALALSDADRARLKREIEERRLAEARLRQVQDELARRNRLAALGQLSASITHELGQPISAMRNYLVGQEIATGAAPGQLAPQLSGLVDRMQGILDQLWSFARRDAEPAQPVDVKLAIDAAYRLVRHSAERERAAITRQLPDGAVTVLGDQNKLEQVIVNLMRNAIDAVAGAEERRITVTLERLDGQAVLTVGDTGPGLGGLDAEALAEPFFTTKASGKGMGLGLAITVQILNSMGGALHAEDAPSGGAVFRITLPLAGEQDA